MPTVIQRDLYPLEVHITLFCSVSICELDKLIGMIMELVKSTIGLLWGITIVLWKIGVSAKPG